MMDFVVRELRAVVDGPMAMLRYDTTDTAPVQSCRDWAVDSPSLDGCSLSRGGPICVCRGSLQAGHLRRLWAGHARRYRLRKAVSAGYVFGAVAGGCGSFGVQSRSCPPLCSVLLSA